MSDKNYSNGPGGSGTVIAGGPTFNGQILTARWQGDGAAGFKLGPVDIVASPTSPVMLRITLTGSDTNNGGNVPSFADSEIMFNEVGGSYPQAIPIGGLIALLLTGATSGSTTVLIINNCSVNIHFTPVAPQAGVTLGAILEIVPLGA